MLYKKSRHHRSLLCRPHAFPTCPSPDLVVSAVCAKLIIFAITSVVLLMSIECFAADARGVELYALLLLSAAGAIVLASATDLMGVLLGMLLSSATGYVLTAYHRADARSGEAGIKYYLLEIGRAHV